MIIGALDIGNTYIKAGIFEKSTLIGTKKCKNEKELLLYLSQYEISKLIISQVGKFDKATISNYNSIYFTHQTPIPIQNKYTTPHTLGIDRLAATIGASTLTKEKDTLIIDAGTCITYDFIDKKETYIGGGISPGIKMKYRSLHNFTSNLPLVDSVEEIHLIGKSTKESIMSGVINGTVSEISGIIQSYQNISHNLALVFCGGDGKFLSLAVDFESIYEENLVLKGLNEVLNFNA